MYTNHRIINTTSHLLHLSARLFVAPSWSSLRSIRIGWVRLFMTSIFWISLFSIWGGRSIFQGLVSLPMAAFGGLILRSGVVVSLLWRADVSLKESADWYSTGGQNRDDCRCRYLELDLRTCFTGFQTWKHNPCRMACPSTRRAR